MRYYLLEIDDSLIKDKRFFNGLTKRLCGHKCYKLSQQDLQDLMEIKSHRIQTEVINDLGNCLITVNKQNNDTVFTALNTKTGKVKQGKQK